MQKIFQSTVRDISLKGLGVVDHPEGKVFFVRGVWIGDQAVFEIEREEKKYGFAKLKELLQPSTHRTLPQCAHLGFDSQTCGGCPWMIVSYDEQLRVKQQLVETTLRRNRLVSDQTKIRDMTASPKLYGYRNRAQVKSDGIKLGYISPGTHNLVDIKECVVLGESVADQFRSLRNTLPMNETDEFVFYDLDSELQGCPQANMKQPFKQANDDQNKFMRSWIFEKLKFLNKDLNVLELFCGSGNFTEVIADHKFKSILAVEGSAESIQLLKQKNLLNVQTRVANLFSAQEVKKISESSKDYDVLVLDPPRDGFEKIGSLVSKMKSLKEIFYVSCDLYTFVRDSKLLIENGFELLEIQPLDQFPHTPHIEVLSYFQKNKG